MSDKIIGQITGEMLVMFIMGVAILLLYLWKLRTDNKKKYTLGHYMNLNVPNILFHLVASFALLFALHELSTVLAENFMPFLKGSTTYELTLSAIIGMSGSPLVAWVYEKSRKIFGNNA